eukprot:c22914_g1_i1 orf=1089-2159(+)
MDKEHIELISWGVFGALGFTFFVVFLVFFHNKYMNRKQSPSRSSFKDDIENSSGRTAATRSLAVERSAIIVPRIFRDFSFAQLEAATDKFSNRNLITVGHSSDLFTGLVEEGELVVIKRFQPKKSERDFFQEEMDVYGRVLDQRFLVPLLGQCVEGDEKLLVYQFMANGDLRTALEAPGNLDAPEDEKRARALPWITRLKIAAGAAEALAYMHHECRPPLVHRNIRSSCILLNDNFEVKLGRLSEVHRLDNAAARPAYDIYSFGKVLLDLLSGLDVSGSSHLYAETWMLKALPLISFQKKASFMEMIDPLLILDEDLEKEVMGVAILAKACTDLEALQHLSMSKIHAMLQNPQTII